ncbi:NrtR DNA-binding winged helix domain-containing protein, partial [Inquilinus limosus]
VVFELMPPTFTLSQLQRTVEALAGLRLHAPNFRRLVDSQGLVEETGEVAGGTGGRPAGWCASAARCCRSSPSPASACPCRAGRHDRRAAPAGAGRP